MNSPALVAVAHGSRDPRSAATIRALVDRVRETAPEIDVRVAFLDLSDPPVLEVLRELSTAGHRRVVIVPLLLGSAYHARVDLPALVDAAARDLPLLQVLITDVLGTDPALAAAARDRLAATGADLADPALGVVFAAVGSSNERANAEVAALARRWQDTPGHRAVVVPAFAGGAKPDVPSAIARLRALGATRFAVASWFLAPGLLPDRIARLCHEAAPEVRIAGPLAADARVADSVLRRYDEAVRTAARSA